MICALMMLVAVSCFEESPSGILRSVSVDCEELVVPQNGSASFLFRVDQTEYAFDLEKDVELLIAKGPFSASKYFCLDRVERDTVPGQYRAFVKDKGESDDYYEEVTLGVRKPDGGMMLSALFHCSGEYGGPLGPVQKTGLPILYLDTQYGAAITSKETYVKAGLSLQEPGSKDPS